MANTAEPVRGDAANGRWITVLQGIRPYHRTMLSRDVVAGITLAALAIPEVMGYTKISGTPVITGLYTMLLPIVAFAIFASSRHLVVGGDSATAAIMNAGIAALSISGLHPYSSQWLALASLSALLVAAFLLLARLARLGFLADFISRTVLVGFLTGVGIQIAMSQLDGMLGVPAPHVSLNAASGAIVKFADTLGEIGVNGSPTKIEMVDEAKGRSQVAQLTAAAVVAIVLLFLTKPLQYLPNAVLAAVVFVIGLKLVDVRNMRKIWRLRKDEFWVV